MWTRWWVRRMIGATSAVLFFSAALRAMTCPEVYDLTNIFIFVSAVAILHWLPFSMLVKYMMLRGRGFWWLNLISIAAFVIIALGFSMFQMPIFSAEHRALIWAAWMYVAVDALDLILLGVSRLLTGAGARAPVT